MFKQAFITFLDTLKSASKGTMAFAAIGLACLLAAVIVVVANNKPAAPASAPAQTSNIQPSNMTVSSEPVHSHLSLETVKAAQTQIQAQAAAKTNGSNKTSVILPKTTNREGAATQARNNQSNSQAATSPTGNNGSTNPTPVNPSQPTTPQADYNLNDNWYFATAGVAGIVNSCWPTPLTIENEAACSDLTSPYYDFLFVGIGIAKTVDAAQTQAGANAQQKADAQHVDPRRGGGDPAVLLTETLCTQNGLSCARW